MQKNVLKCHEMGPEGFLNTNPDLADILGRTDSDFEICFCLDFSGPKFLAWAHVGPPTWAPRGPHVGPPTWAPRGPKWGNMGAKYFQEFGPIFYGWKIFSGICLHFFMGEKYFEEFAPIFSWVKNILRSLPPNLSWVKNIFRNLPLFFSWVEHIFRKLAPFFWHAFS